MKLYSDWTYLQQEMDCSFPDRFLMALRAFDNRTSVCPFLVESKGRRFGLFLHVEKGNVEAAQLPPSIEPVFYNRYFDFNEAAGDPVHASLEDAVAAVAATSGGSQSIEVDRALPWGIVRRLAARFDVRIEQGAAPDPVTLRPVPRSEVLARHAAHRPAGIEAARGLLQTSRHREPLFDWLAHPGDDRAERMDRDLADAGARAVLAASDINMQELAGVPMRGPHRPLAVLWRRDADPLVVERGTRADGQTFASLAHALDALVPEGPLLVEADALPCGLAQDAALDRRDTGAGDVLLRRWRDQGTAADLAFYVIATRASRAAIYAALDFVREGLTAGQAMRETDAYAVYRAELHAFFARHAPGFTVARTLTNFHATARTTFPANAAPFPLMPGRGTLKIDAGCLVVGADGMMLGCSDIARTLCLDPAGEPLLDLFREGVRDVLIPACRTGASGGDIHRLATAHVDAAEGRLGDMPLYRTIGAPGAYARDVGHLLGRNNLAHLTFTADQTGVLEPGMVACCEYQWPVGEQAIAYEDTCLVTDEGGLNLTVD